MPLSCERQAQFHGGRIHGFYATLLDDGKRFTTYKKYCANCLMELVKEHHSDWLPGLAAFRVEQHTQCTSCSMEVQKERDLKPLYITFFTENRQKVSYYGFYCEGCADVARNIFDLAESRNGRS
jgi:hypothetical protein